MRAEEVAGTEELLEESSLQQSKGFLMSKRVGVLFRIAAEFCKL
jgi:hypothetical protein